MEQHSDVTEGARPCRILMKLLMRGGEDRNQLVLKNREIYGTVSWCPTENKKGMSIE